MKLSLPLLVLDEAHRVRNGGTQLAALLKASREDLDAAGGQLADRFDRMLFLTATPFQLGHAELTNVLRRFEAINWNGPNVPEIKRAAFNQAIVDLHKRLDAMQGSTERLERTWKRLLEADASEASHLHGVEWWNYCMTPDDPQGLSVSNERVRAVMLAFQQAKEAIGAAESQLRPWVLRSSRSRCLPAPFKKIVRRERIEGVQVLQECVSDGEIRDATGGLRVSMANALPFMLAARLATLPGGRKVFVEGIASSFEALLDTHRDEETEDNAGGGAAVAAEQADWYLTRLRDAAQSMSLAGGDRHPKMKATVDLAMALWRKGEKVLIFCHYRQTGRALHRQLSEAMLKEIDDRACELLGCERASVAAELRKIADALDRDRSAAKEVAEILDGLLSRYPELGNEQLKQTTVDIVLRFLRTPTFLVRFGGLSSEGVSKDWVAQMFDRPDLSGMCLRDLVHQFLEFLARRSSDSDRFAYLDALQSLQTGTHAGPEIEASFSDDESRDGDRAKLVANVRRVYGETREETRQRIMLTFNTPFYPEILISSSVMAEGVDLHLNCRHVIHHDLDWNPSSLEQRTGRIDRLGAKAERSGKPIRIYLPYVEGCQDEKLFRVVMDRERWFGVVMGAEQAMSRVLSASAWEIERMALELPVPALMVEQLRLRLESVNPAMETPSLLISTIPTSDTVKTSLPFEVTTRGGEKPGVTWIG